jgi:hypothetical protein
VLICDLFKIYRVNQVLEDSGRRNRGGDISDREDEQCELNRLVLSGKYYWMDQR